MMQMHDRLHLGTSDTLFEAVEQAMRFIVSYVSVAFEFDGSISIFRARPRRSAPQTVARQTPAVSGFEPFPARDVIVTNEFIDRLRDAEGI